MADYCEQTDIESNMKGVVFSSSTAISEDAIADIITQESATIDVYLQARYTLPIVDTSALSFLKKICIALVVHRATLILQPKDIRPIPNENAEQDISTLYAYRQAMGFLKGLSKGEINLPSEAQESKSNFSSTAVNNADECEFVFHEKQW